MIIDTHSHLYAEEFDLDRFEVLNRASQVGVGAILLPNIDTKALAHWKPWPQPPQIASQ